jgi:hypothetical protein
MLLAERIKQIWGKLQIMQQQFVIVWDIVKLIYDKIEYGLTNHWQGKEYKNGH